MDESESLSYFGTLVPPQNLSCSTFKSYPIITAGAVIYLLFLPIYIVVFWLGYRKRSSSPAGSVSLFDMLTYHMTAVDTVGIAGACLFCFGVHVHDWVLRKLGSSLLHSVVIGQVNFHCLACVERYLAVVYPITYLRLKTRGGVSVRNLIFAGTWLATAICAAVIGFSLFSQSTLIYAFVMSSLTLTITMFCSVSVLRALVRPGPGEGKRGNRSKRSAFYTIMIIQGALLVKFIALLLYYSLTLLDSPLLDKCVLLSIVFLFELPSSLALPLLFLLKETKLLCYNSKK